MDNTKESLQNSIILRKKKSNSFGLIVLDKVEGRKKSKIMNYLKKIGLEPYPGVEDDGRPVICADVSNQSLEGIRLKLTSFLERLSGSDSSYSTSITNTTAYTITQSFKGSSTNSCDKEFTFVKSDDMEDIVKAFGLVLNNTDMPFAESEDKSNCARSLPPKEICKKVLPETPQAGGEKLQKPIPKEKSVQVDRPKKKFWHTVIPGLSGRKTQKDSTTTDKGYSKNKDGQNNEKKEVHKSRFLNLDVYTQTKSICSNSQEISQHCSECTTCSCTCPSRSMFDKNVYSVPLNFSSTISRNPFYTQPKLFIFPQDIVRNSKSNPRYFRKDIKEFSSDTCACVSSSSSPIPSLQEGKSLRKINFYLRDKKMKHRKTSDSRIVSLKRLRIVKAEKSSAPSSGKFAKKDKEHLVKKDSDSKKESKKLLKNKPKSSIRRNVKQLEKLRNELKILSVKVDNLAVKKIDKVDASVDAEKIELDKRSTNDVGVECDDGIAANTKVVECVNASTEVDFVGRNGVDENPKENSKEETETSSSYINIDGDLLNNIESFIKTKKNLNNIKRDKSKADKTKIINKQKKEIGKLKVVVNHMKSQIESTLSSKSNKDITTNEDYHFWFSRPKTVGN